MKEQLATHATSHRHASQDTQASVHQAGHYVGLHPEDHPYLTDERRPAPPHYDAEDAIYDTRRPTSSRRYHVPVTQGPRTLIRYHEIPPRRSRTQDYPPAGPPVPRSAARQNSPSRSTSTPRATAPATQTRPQARAEQRPTRRREWHWLVSVGLGMSAVLVLFVVGTTVIHWWNSTQDNLHYGFPRTYQCDAVVGHGDSSAHPSHFIALNWNGHIDVIEFPGGDASHAKVYLVSQLIGANKQDTPVTLTFQDVNGGGQPDMLVHIGSQTVVFINDHGTFRPATPTDHLTL